MPKAQLWSFTAMEWAGLYGTQIAVCASSKQEAVDEACAQARRLIHSKLRAAGYAYGMSSTDFDLSAKIAARLMAYRQEAETLMAPQDFNAMTLRSPGDR